MILDEESKKSIEVETKIAIQVQEGAKQLVISDQTQYEQAAETLKQVAAKLRALETMRTQVTKPLNQALRQFNAYFKTPKDHYTAAKNTLQQAMKKFHFQQEALRQEALQKAQEASTQEAYYHQAEVAHNAMVQKASNVHTRDVWKFEVTDVTKVPLDFMMVNEQALRAFVKQYQDQYQVPGVKIYKDTIVVAR